MNAIKQPSLLFYFGGFSPVGGIETFSYNLLTHIQNHGYSCKLLCWGKLSPLLKKLKQTNVQLVRYVWRWGCKWQLPDWLLLPFGQKCVRSADVVIFGKLFPTAILKSLQQWKKDSSKWVYITPYRPIPPKSPAETRQLLERLNLFDAIVVQAKCFETDLRQIGYAGMVEVLPYIPQPPKPVQPFPQGEILQIGFLGRLVPDKNLPLLLKAFQRFRKSYQSQYFRDAQLQLFGDGALRTELEEFARELDLQESIVFHGVVPQEQVDEKIASCHLFAFTSHVEGQCLAALEILSGGRPIVATGAGALPDILSDRRLGRLVEVNTSDVVAEGFAKVAQLIEQNVLTAQIIHESYLERYAPTTVGNSYIEILNLLCDRHIKVESQAQG
jgi:glycosyltransferase involved in cell wall biosynthesis